MPRDNASSSVPPTEASHPHLAKALIGAVWHRKPNDKIRAYVASLAKTNSVLHKIDGYYYYLICMLSLDNRLPVPFTIPGQ